MKAYLDTENKILGNLLRTPLESKSLHKIALDTKLTYVTVYNAIPNLILKKTIEIEKKGKSNLASIDFENASVERLSSAIIYERERFYKMNPKISLISKEIEESLNGMFYILILFGSYAKGNFKKDSDIDLLFIVPSRENIEQYKHKIRKALSISPEKKKDFNVVCVEDFKDMLNQKYSVGREAFQTGIVLFGAEHYYALVKQYVRTKGY